MSIIFKKAGILTTVQDTGRNGFRRYGINQNGAMDRTAVRLINALLGNDEKTAVLEMHFPAAEILFEDEALFALGGADFSAQLDGLSLENWRIHHAVKGSTLKFTGKSFGNRAYLSVRGGFKIESWLGSAATNLKAKIGGFHGRKIEQGDRLALNATAGRQSSIANIKVSNSLIPFYSKFPTVRVTAGAEYENLTPFCRENFIRQTYVITQHSDRMGFRLRGEPLYLRDAKEMVSSAVSFGTIQLLPDGQLIVLMADHQTTGGYPRIAGVIPTDLPLLAQLGANDKVAFHLISLEEAENPSMRFEKDLKLMKTALQFR